MSDVVFVDTNILVYAHDADAGAKRERAVDKLRELWEADTGSRRHVWRLDSGTDHG